MPLTLGISGGSRSRRPRCLRAPRSGSRKAPGLDQSKGAAEGRVATGGGFAARALYTDVEEQIFDFVRPIILNGIDDIASRADLADRCLLIRLPSIPPEKRKRDKALWRDFELAAPAIFGALLTGLAGALREEESVVLTC